MSWGDIAFGVARGLISRKEVANYALSCINESTEDKDLPALLNLAYDEPSKSEMVSICESFSSPTELLGAEERWRYALVYDALFCDEVSGQKLERLAEIYAFFGYPEEMSYFIYYMPQLNNSIDNDGIWESSGERILAKARRYLAEKKPKL